MKFTATLAASAYAVATAVTGVTAPTAITSGETANTATFPGTTGVWTWLLYGATASDEDGYYLRIVTSAATKGAVIATPAYTTFAMTTLGAAATGAETGLIKYLVVADDDNSGQEISWNVAYSGSSGDTWSSIALTQTFGAAASVSATGTTALTFAANTGANAWYAYSYENNIWDGTTAPSVSMFRLTPDESTTTDARPNVGDAATAYYLVADGTTAITFTGANLTGTTLTTVPTVSITWAGAATVSAADATVAVASLF